MLCVTQSNGALTVLDPQPADVTQCWAVIQSPYEAMTVPWALSVSDGQAVGTSFLAVLAVGWCFRMLIRQLFSVDEEKETT